MTEARPLGPLLRRPEVERETGLSRSTIYERMDAGTFPRPRRIGRRAVAWPATEIEAWKAEQPFA
ncbi:helix-turn-helix transcriptional regulator [Sphingomonas sp. IC081]|uniref:helix-turn-helix transcriptional regulator n=1 Tax=Sphingomonas sp. IC081 TaxID=304378 RepID=UPI001158FCF4|nr:AlpA family phage regulatory protein [Sphingomonas sp. IC081]QDK32541.1 transcriptional regulator [Sphingomonas sp. IC081]